MLRGKNLPSDLDLWPWKSIGFQTLLRTKYVPSLVKIHWRMLILECSQGCYAVKIWPGDLHLWATVHSKCIDDHTLRSDIFLPKCPTHSREMSDKFESQHSNSDYLVRCESGYLKIFFTFLEVNMSNILWSMRICKHTFFPVCRMSWYVNTLVYFYLAPYSYQER